MLISIALFKIQRLLRDGLRLRTACDLEVVGELTLQRPEGFTVPSLKDLEDEKNGLPALIKKTSSGFAKPSATDLTFED